jgi:hypothetical protein
MKYIKYPCLGFVIKEINFTKDKKHYLIYSADDEDLKMVSTDKVLELIRPNDGTLFFYKKRIKSILKSFICAYTGLVMDDDISINKIEEDVITLTNKLFL